MSGISQVAALMTSIDQYSNFRQMAEYNISCLMSYITPPTVGWRENVAAAVDNKGVQNIIQTMRKHPDSLDMVRLATTSLTGLAISKDNAGIVAQNGGIETALNCMLKMQGNSSEELEVVDSGAKLLETVARFNPGSIVGAPNAVASVLSGLNHTRIPRVQIASARVLDTVGKTPEGIDVIVNQNGIQQLIESMRPGKRTDEQMLMPVFSLLERLAKTPQFLHEIRRVGAVEALVAQLDAHADNEDILRAGGRLLAKISIDDVGDIIEKLQQNLPDATREHLIGLLSNLMLQPENVDKIIKLNGIGAIMHGFDRFSPQTKAAALRAIQRIAHGGASHVKEIANAGVIPGIVQAFQQALAQNDEQVMKAATQALTSIVAAGPEAADLVTKLGGSSAIMGALTSHATMAGFADSGLDFLDKLTLSGLDTTAFIKAGMLNCILYPMELNGGEKVIQGKGLKILSNLMGSEDLDRNILAAKQLTQNELVPAMIKALRNHPSDNEVVKHGVSALAKVMKLNPASKDVLSNLGALDALVDAVYQQLELEMHGQSRLRLNADYVRDTATALSILVTSRDVQGTSGQLLSVKPDIQAMLLKRVAVFAVHTPFAQTLLKDHTGAKLAKCLSASLPAQIVVNAVAIWSFAKSGLNAMSDIADSGAMKQLLTSAKLNGKTPEAVIACLKALQLFAGNPDFKERLQGIDAVSVCVTCMRASADNPGIQSAAIELMLLLATNEVGAASISYKGGVKQVNKMIKDTSTTEEFEKPTTKAMLLLYKVANVDKADVREQLRKADTIGTVTVAMATYPSNEDVIEYGGRILALLMNEEDVGKVVDDVRNLTKALPGTTPKKLPQALNTLGNKAATVGFLALNKGNKNVMEAKHAPAVVNNALMASQRLPMAPTKEGAVRNEYRAVGQLGSLITPHPQTKDYLLQSLVAPSEQISNMEKVGVLEGIKYMAFEPTNANEFLARSAPRDILDLIQKNRDNAPLVLAALNALSLLLDNPKGVGVVTHFGGRDVVFDILRDEAKNLGPKVTAAALEALTKLSKDPKNAKALAKDGAIDAVTSALAYQVDQEDTTPSLLAGAAKFLNAMANGDDGNAEKIVFNGALKMLLDLASSSQDYLGDPDVMGSLADLLNTLADSNVDNLLDKLNEMGAIDLVMLGMDFNPQDEKLQLTSQQVLQKLVGGSEQALEHSLRDLDGLLDAVTRRPDNSLGLDRLNRGLMNLSNLLLVPGAVDTNGASQIMARAVKTYDVVSKTVPDKVGPVKPQILETAVQTIGRAVMVPGEMEINSALKRLVDGLGNENPGVQTESLKALGNLLSQPEAGGIDPKGWTDLIDLVNSVDNKTTSPEVKAAAKQVIDKIMDKLSRNPAMLLAMGPSGDDALGSILAAISDPRDLNDLLRKLCAADGGPDALMRLALNPKFPPELRKDILNALTDIPDNLLVVPSNLIPSLLDRLNAKDTDSDEKLALLNLLANSKISPMSADNLLKNHAVEGLLDLLGTETDPNLIAGALRALGNLANDPMLAKRLAALGGADRIVDGMKQFRDDAKVQEEGFNALTSMQDALGGPEDINLSPDAIKYLEGALNGLTPGARNKASKFIGDLNDLYNGEVEPMVISRFDNMLDALRAAKDWRELHDPKSGKPYYYNVATKETTWQKPAVMIAAEQALNQLKQLAEKAPAEIDQNKLRAAIGHFDEHAAEPLRLKALAKALAALASNDSNRDAMVKHGVLEAIVKAMNGKNVDREFILAAIALLNQFAKHKTFKLQICRLGGIRALILIMKRYMEDEEIVEKAAQCLANLAFNSTECIQEIIKWEGPQVVGLALKRHKQAVPLIVNCMTLISNCMYKSVANKQLIGDLLRERIMIVLRKMFKDAAVLKQTARALGNIAFIDDHVRYVTAHGAVKTLVAGMQHNIGNIDIVKTGIQVIGNFASVNNDDYQEEIRTGKMVSVLSTIWHEGAAKFIVDTFGNTRDPGLVSSCIQTLIYLLEDPDISNKLVHMGVVPLIFDALTFYDDPGVQSFCVESIEYLSYTFEGVKAIYESEGVAILLQQMTEYQDDHELLETMLKALKNMCSLKDVNKPLSAKIMSDITQQGGIDIIITGLETNAQYAGFVISAMRFLTQMVAMRNEVSSEIAAKGMNNILKALNIHSRDVDVLEVAYQLMGILAFEKENLKIIVQYGGITLIVNSILAFPEKERLVKRSIQTLDNIAMASQEHSNIVRDASGKKVIEELIKTYETIPGKAAEDVVQACQAALLSLSKIETRLAKPRYIFTNDNGLDDPSVDTLKDHRHFLKAGGFLYLCTNGQAKQKQFFVSKDWHKICYSGPKSRKNASEIALKNVVSVGRGWQKPHGNKTPENLAFFIVTTNNTIYLKANNPQQREQWVEAFEALRRTFRNNKRWLA